MNRWRDRQMDIHQMDLLVGEQLNRWLNRQIDIHTDGQTGLQIDSQTDIDGWTNGHTGR